MVKTVGRKRNLDGQAPPAKRKAGGAAADPSGAAAPTPIKRYNFERSAYRWFMARHPAEFERFGIQTRTLERAPLARQAFYESGWEGARRLIKCVDGRFERTVFFDNLIERGLRAGTRFCIEHINQQESEELGIRQDAATGKFYLEHFGSNIVDGCKKKARGETQKVLMKTLDELMGAEIQATAGRGKITVTKAVSTNSKRRKVTQIIIEIDSGSDSDDDEDDESDDSGNTDEAREAADLAAGAGASGTLRLGNCNASHQQQPLPGMVMPCMSPPPPPSRRVSVSSGGSFANEEEGFPVSLRSSGSGSSSFAARSSSSVSAAAATAAAEFHESAYGGGGMGGGYMVSAPHHFPAHGRTPPPRAVSPGLDVKPDPIALAAAQAAGTTAAAAAAAATSAGHGGAAPAVVPSPPPTAPAVLVDYSFFGRDEEYGGIGGGGCSSDHVSGGGSHTHHGYGGGASYGGGYGHGAYGAYGDAGGHNNGGGAHGSGGVTEDDDEAADAAAASCRAALADAEAQLRRNIKNLDALDIEILEALF